MNLYEYQAKGILRENDIPVPAGSVCSTETEVIDAFAHVGRGGEAVLKPQVSTGGRGKPEGIRIVRSPDEAVSTFLALMKMKINGVPVWKVLIEERTDIRNQYYAGITIDPTFSKPILLISSKGGVEIETIAKKTPEALYEYVVSPRYGIPSYQILKAMDELGISNELSFQFVDIIRKLHSIFRSHDSTLIEINPLVESTSSNLIAADARLNVDDNSLFKHQDFEAFREDFLDNPEISLRDQGVHFVYTGGNIGLICVGAGMSMATMDLVASMGGKPACFCDISAGINPQSMEIALQTVSNLSGVKSILINMFGGLTRMDQVARSFTAAWQNMAGISQPIVIRLEGTNVEDGRKIMAEHGFDVFTNLYDAVKKAVDLGK
jgi:succinyl-CoA synthetase beta subunit